MVLRRHTEGCYQHVGWTLLYIGITPSRPVDEPSSNQTLRARLRTHLNGNAEGSTLRLTLGVLLSDQLSIELRRVGSSGRRLTFTKAGEDKLSGWMDRHIRVTWLEHDTPWEVEAEALDRLSLPLNLRGNEHHPFYSTLKKRRKEARAHARELPIAR